MQAREEVHIKPADRMSDEEIRSLLAGAVQQFVQIAIEVRHRPIARTRIAEAEPRAIVAALPFCSFEDASDHQSNDTTRSLPEYRRTCSGPKKK